jgi:ABC-type antimicrobial peptide transport system permease subunit
MILGAEDSGGLGMTAGFAGTLAVCAFVVSIAMISCAVPLGRALRIEPTEAVRTDA